MTPISNKSAEQNQIVEEVQSSQLSDEQSNLNAESYKSVGFHRLLGGWYYNMILFLFGIIFFILMFAIIIPIILPYPEITGYERVVYGLLGFTFGFFDFGSTKSNSAEGGAQLSEGLLRFLGEYSTKNPYQAIRYVQFFSWFQMITGIIQITLISLVALVWIPFTEMGHLIWFILAYSLIQFPGCTQIFESIFKGFQRIDAWASFTFIKDTIIKYGVQITCVLIGRKLGFMYPVYGEVVGATVGYIASLWFIELTAFTYGAFVFRIKLGKNLGLRVKDIFTPDFNKKIAKETLTFSGKIWVGGMIGQLFTLFSNLLIISLIPAYSVWLGLIAFGYQLSAIVSMQGIMIRNSTAPLSEAFLNGKKHLFDYYIESLLKYHGFITTYLLVPFYIFFPMILGGLIGVIPGLSQYSPLVDMLPLLLVVDALVGPIGSLGGKLFPATDKPLTGVLLGLISSPVSLLVIYICSQFGLSWEAIILARFISSIIQQLIYFIAFHKIQHKLPLFKKGFLWQAVVAPLLTALTTIPLLLLLRNFVVMDLLAKYPIPTGAIMAMFCLFVYSIFIYAPVFGFFGGFDDNSLKLFEKSIPLAGPSKIIMKAIRFMLSLGIKISPFHNKFPLPYYEEAEKERYELNKMMNS